MRRYTDEKQEEKEEYQKFADQLVHTILQNAQQSEKIEQLSKEIQVNQAQIDEKVDQMKELRQVFLKTKILFYNFPSENLKKSRTCTDSEKRNGTIICSTLFGPVKVLECYSMITALAYLTVAILWR